MDADEIKLVIEAAEKGDYGPLALCIRSLECELLNPRLPPEITRLAANVLQKLSQGRGRPKSSTLARDLEIVHAFRRCQKKGLSYKAALIDTCAELHVSKTLVENALKKFKEFGVEFTENGGQLVDPSEWITPKNYPN